MNRWRATRWRAWKLHDLSLDPYRMDKRLGNTFFVCLCSFIGGILIDSDHLLYVLGLVQDPRCLMLPFLWVSLGICIGIHAYLAGSRILTTLTLSLRMGRINGRLIPRP